VERGPHTCAHTHERVRGRSTEVRLPEGLGAVDGLKEPEDGGQHVAVRRHTRVGGQRLAQVCGVAHALVPAVQDEPRRHLSQQFALLVHLLLLLLLLK